MPFKWKTTQSQNTRFLKFFQIQGEKLLLYRNKVSIILRKHKEAWCLGDVQELVDNVVTLYVFMIIGGKK